MCLKLFLHRYNADNHSTLSHYRVEKNYQKMTPNSGSAVRELSFRLARRRVSRPRRKPPSSPSNPADWVGAIVGVVREGVGADASPEALVGYIDDCPEVEGVVDPDETTLVEMVFELILPAWEAAGAVDQNRRLTLLGRWGLPRALAWAFDHDFDNGPAP